MRVFIEVILILTLLGVLVFCSGCSVFQKKPTEIPTLTPRQQLTKTLESTNWLVTISIIGIGAAFFAFLNGSSKGLQAMATCFVVLSVL